MLATQLILGRIPYGVQCDHTMPVSSSRGGGSPWQELGEDVAAPAAGWIRCKPGGLGAVSGGPHGCHHGQTTHPIYVARCPHLHRHHLFLKHSLQSTAVGRSQPLCWSLLQCGCHDTPLLHLVAPEQPELQVPGVEVSALGTAGSWAAVLSREQELP